MLSISGNGQRYSFGANIGFPTHQSFYSWDFKQRIMNGTKIAGVPEMSRGFSHAFEQPVSASQPDAVANGAGFTADFSRSMALAAPVPLNGATGVYVGMNVFTNTLDAAHSYLLKIFGSSTYNYGRLKLTDLDFGANRRIFSYINNSDSTLYERALQSGTYSSEGQWLTIEVLHDFVTPANDKIWINGVAAATTLSSPYNPASYPVTDSAGAEIGANLYGEINALGILEVYAGKPIYPIITPFSSWLNSVRPL